MKPAVNATGNFSFSRLLSMASVADNYCYLSAKLYRGKLLLRQSLVSRSNNILGQD